MPPFDFESRSLDTATLGVAPVPSPLPVQPVRDELWRDPLERRREMLRRMVPVPHEQTFAAIYNYGLNIYRTYSDEATRRNWQDALAMKRSDFIHGLMRHRQLPVVGLPFHLESDNPRDEGQKQVVARLTQVINAIPHFQDLKLALSEAIWYGKAGVQYGVAPVQVDGRPATGIVTHEPINGDKIVYRFDAFGRTPGILIKTNWTPPRPQDKQYIKKADRGWALFLCDPFYRDRFIIHKFEPTDFDFLFEAEKAAGVHGTGLRDRIYWAWWLREELLSYAMDALQRLSTNGMLYYEYQSGNQADEEAGIAALKMLIRDSVAAVPIQGGQKTGNDAIKHIEISPVGYDILLKFLNYLDDNIRRCILGQDATSGAAGEHRVSTAKTAEAQESTFDSIKRFDATSLAEALTSQLLKRLIRLNYPKGLPFGVRLRFPIDRQDVGERAAGLKMAFDMGLELSKRQTYEALGASPPEDDADILKTQQPDPMATLMGGQGPGGNGNGHSRGGLGQYPPDPQSSTDGSGIPGGAKVPAVLRQAMADRSGSGTPRVPPGGLARHARKLPAEGQGSFSWSEDKHPRGQLENAGQFRARESPAPLPTRSKGPAGPATPPTAGLRTAARRATLAWMSQALTTAGPAGISYGSVDTATGEWQIRIGTVSDSEGHYDVFWLGPEDQERAIDRTDSLEAAVELADAELTEARQSEEPTPEPDEQEIDPEAIEAQVRSQPLPTDLVPKLEDITPDDWLIGGRNADGEQEAVAVRVKQNPRAKRGEALYLVTFETIGEEAEGQEEGFGSREEAREAAERYARDWHQQYVETAYNLAVMRAVEEAESRWEEEVKDDKENNDS